MSFTFDKFRGCLLDTISTKKVLCFGCSCTRQQRLGGLKMQFFKNDTVIASNRLCDVTHMCILFHSIGA